MGQERKGITLCEVYIKVQQEVLILFDQLQTNMNFFFIHSCDKGIHCKGISRLARCHYLWPSEEETDLSLKYDHYDLLEGKYRFEI